MNEIPKSGFLEELSRIPSSQVEQAIKQVRKDVLNESFFVIPNNDGEAVRAAKILRAARAPHLDATPLPWGVKLDEMFSTPGQIKYQFIERLQKIGVKRVVLFELPAPNLEKALKDHGFEVTIIDHHKYSEYDRWKPESSLEQLMTLINWPKSRADEAIAVNDRGYVPGMKKMGLTDDEIRQVRLNDYIGQGQDPRAVRESFRQAEEALPKLKTREGVYILDLPPDVNPSVVKEELAIRAKDGLASSIEIYPGKIGFSGNPKIVNAFLEKID
ncbi:MAG: hypothetical protein ACJ763_17695, partial [Bdellovibrionia bacterium]